MRMIQGVTALLASALAVPLPAAERNSSWERLQSLVGEWEGREAGRPARVSYRLVSSGMALMETMEAPDATEMVTVYHPDGDAVAMTHYCSTGHPARMRASAPQASRMDFAYVDAANVRSPADHRMTRLVLTFPGTDRLVQEWTSRADGKEQVGRFEFTRKR